MTNEFKAANHKVLSTRIDLNRDDSAVAEDVKNLVKDMLTLSVEEANNLLVRPLTGGLTNRLFLVENISRPELNVIVRFFGEGTHEFIDRNAENMVFSALSDHEFGPKFEGLFENGRVEGYINARCLVPEEMSQPNVYNSVASLVHRLHSLHLPTFFAYQRGWQGADGSEHTKSNHASPWIWKKIELFFNMSNDIIKRYENTGDHDKQTKLAEYKALNVDRMIEQSHLLQHRIEKILHQLSHHMHYHDHVHGLKAPDGVHDLVSMRDKGMAYALEEVLCHNDLLSGNLLIQKTDGQIDIRLIDFEYASYNYRCYDLANHFCEFSGFEFDVKNFPNAEVRRNFIKAYLTSSRVKDVYDDEFVDGFENMVLLMTLVSCLFWGTWAIVQSGKNLGIEFDYVSYAKRRYDAYFYFEEEFDLQYM